MGNPVLAVPSQQEVKKKGLNVEETNKILLKKVEELTLYIIELNEKVKKLESR